MANAKGAVNFGMIKGRAPIERIVEDYGVTLKKSGRQLVGCCPIHKGSNPRAFVVDPQKNVWRCFADCDRGGTVLDLVCEMENVSLKEAALMIALRFGFDPDIDHERSLPMSGTQPTHRAYAVEGEGDDAFWTRVGSVWAHKDGKGFNINLSALPVNGRLVLREMSDEEAEKKTAKSNGRKK